MLEMNGWRAACGALVLVSLCALLVRDSRRALFASAESKQARAVGWQALAVAWLGALYLPTSSLLFPSTVLAADRLLFAPSLAVVLVLGWIVSLWLHRDHHRRTLASAALVATLFAGGLQTHAVANDWRSDRLLFERGVRLYPRCVRMQYNLGRHHFVGGEITEAIEHLQNTLALRADDRAALTLLIQAHTREQRCQGVEALVDRGLALQRVSTGVRKAALDWAITCRRFKLAWRVGQTLTSSGSEWPRKVFIAAIAAGDQAGATRWARRFVDQPWKSPMWVSAAVFAEEHAGRPRAALGHLVALQDKSPQIKRLDRVASALCKRHIDHVDHAAMVSMTRATWPQARGRPPP
jgi:hypothetical protein